MSETFALTVIVPIWFLWMMSGMLSVWAVLEVIRLVVDYRLRRLKAELGKED